VQSKFLVTNHNRVTCVVATLVANYIINFVAKQICGFTFTFVTPLGSN
jgi:hypothetical protein